MTSSIIEELTAKDDNYACTIADKIISESQNSNKWCKYFDDFARLLKHPKSLVRNRAIHILASMIQWDSEDRFDFILDDFLIHITDEKPITARQCIKALSKIGTAKPQYIQKILFCFHSADLSKYKDSMRPLIEKDMKETEETLKNLL